MPIAFRLVRLGLQVLGKLDQPIGRGRVVLQQCHSEAELGLSAVILWARHYRSSQRVPSKYVDKRAAPKMVPTEQTNTSVLRAGHTEGPLDNSTAAHIPENTFGGGLMI